MGSTEVPHTQKAATTTAVRRIENDVREIDMTRRGCADEYTPPGPKPIGTLVLLHYAADLGPLNLTSELTMRYTILPCTILAIAMIPDAANGQNRFELFPGPLTWSSRGDLGAGAGETLQGVHASHHRGFGDTGFSCKISGLGARLQDQDRSTPETYRWIVRSGSDGSGPGTGSGAVIADIGPFVTPSGGSGVAAWQLDTIFSSAITLPDCTSHFSFGVSLAAAPNWDADGLSTHASADTEQNSHSGQEDHAWQILSGAPSATHPSDKRTWRYSLLVDNGALQIGSFDRYGMGGMFPRIGSSLTVRVHYPSNTQDGLSFLVLDTSRSAGIPVAAGTSRLFLSGLTAILPVELIDSQGTALHTVFTALPSAAAGLGTFHFQAGAKKNNVWTLSNSQSLTR